MSDFDPISDQPQRGPRPAALAGAQKRDNPSDVAATLTPLAASGPTVRTSMVRKLVDIVVLPQGKISFNERALVADLLLHLVDKVELALRIEIAKRISRVSECPPALMRMLLLDAPEVAVVLAENAQNVPEALLIEAARDGTLQHRLAIARRLDLSASVADACLAYEESEVCKLILKRESCDLSPNAVNKLVALSAINKDIQSLLLRRKELEPAHGFIMFWWMDAERRRRILTRFALDRSVVQEALADLYPRVFRGGDPDDIVKEILILAERRHRPRGLNGEPVSMDVVKRTLEAAWKYPSDDIIEATAAVGGVSKELAARILQDPGGEAFAVLCKSLGVARGDFFEFLTNAAESQEAKDRADQLLATFDSMARDFSRAVLRYWDWDSNPRIAHISRMMVILQDDININDLGDMTAYA